MVSYKHQWVRGSPKNIRVVSKLIFKGYFLKLITLNILICECLYFHSIGLFSGRDVEHVHGEPGVED